MTGPQLTPLESNDIKININDSEIPFSSSAKIKKVLENEADSTKDITQGQENIDESNHFQSRLRIALYAGFCELLIALSYCLLILPFMEKRTRWFNSPFVLLSLLLINFITRLMNLEKIETLKYISYGVRGINFSAIDIQTIDMLFHELGHYIAVILFLKSPVNIVMHTSLTNAYATTYFNSDHLTNLGERVGYENSRILIAAAGPMFQVMRNFTSLLIAQCLSNNRPEISTYIRVRVVYSLFSIFLYNISPYYLNCDQNNTNDYCYLEKAGAPPYALALGMLGSILFFQCTLSGISYIRQNKTRIVQHESRDIELGHNQLANRLVKSHR